MAEIKDSLKEPLIAKSITITTTSDVKLVATSAPVKNAMDSWLDTELKFNKCITESISLNKKQHPHALIMQMDNFTSQVLNIVEQFMPKKLNTDLLNKKIFETCGQCVIIDKDYNLVPWFWRSEINWAEYKTVVDKIRDKICQSPIDRVSRFNFGFYSEDCNMDKVDKQIEDYGYIYRRLVGILADHTLDDVKKAHVADCDVECLNNLDWLAAILVEYRTIPIEKRNNFIWAKLVGAPSADIMKRLMVLLSRVAKDCSKDEINLELMIIKHGRDHPIVVGMIREFLLVYNLNSENFKWRPIQADDSRLMLGHDLGNMVYLNPTADKKINKVQSGVRYVNTELIKLSKFMSEILPRAQHLYVAIHDPFQNCSKLIVQDGQGLFERPIQVARSKSAEMYGLNQGYHEVNRVFRFPGSWIQRPSYAHYYIFSIAGIRGFSEGVTFNMGKTKHKNLEWLINAQPLTIESGQGAVCGIDNIDPRILCLCIDNGFGLEYYVVDGHR